ncbi:MSCRAMM family protein [Cryobacterium sp. AP23]
MPRRSPIRPARTRLATRASIGVAALVGTLLIVVPTATAIAARPATVPAATTETPAPTDPPVGTPLQTATASPTANATPTPSTSETPSPTATATPTPTATSTPTATATPTPTATATPTPSATATPAPTQPASGAINSTSVTGRVTDQVTGAPLAGVSVYIYTEAGGYGTAIPITTTDADGNYTFYSLDVRSYTLNFVSSDYRSEWLGGAADQSDATTFPVALGEAVAGIDASLLPNHSISGTATFAGSSVESLAGTTVSAYAPNGSLRGSATTSPDGGYTIADLIPGSYTVRFTPPVGSAFVGQWWHDQTHPSTAAPVKLAVDTAVTGKNVALAAAATVTGRITASTTGAAIPGAWVYAYATDRSGDLVGGSIAAASTNANGDYTLSGLAAGTYTLQFSGGSANGSDAYLREWQGNTTRPNAESFTLTAGQTVANTDAALTPTASISGTVFAAGARNVGLNAATVSAVAANGGVAATATTNGSGDYTLTGLKPGRYTLRFAAPDGTSFGSTWWHDSASNKSAGVIRVTAGEVVTGKTAELATNPAK